MILFVFSLVRPAHAGFFADIFRFLTSDETKKSSSGADASEFAPPPLLGSQAAAILAQGVGGPVDDSVSPLQVTQESALVGFRNPMGTLTPLHQGTIVVYAVQHGDTPSSIAARFDISLNTLLWANNIKDPNMIHVGDELIILPITGVQYEVKKGDTISSIAKEFKGNADDIMSFNGLPVGVALVPGTVLIVPDGELAEPPRPRDSGLAGKFVKLLSYDNYFLRPIAGGRKSRGIHGYNGIDLAHSCGIPVLASAEGRVIAARASGWNGGYGTYLVITHPRGPQTLYAHLSALFIRHGELVSQGQVVGLVGNTGNSTGCHLHFEVRGAQNPF